MYIFFTAFLLIIIFFAILNHCRAKSIRKKICCLSTCEKIQQLNDLMAPFGFYYSPCQDIFTSCIDAWQREFGYCALYDQAAPFAQMVIDCEPVYFDYEGRTWLIELWKGQYGINTGAEIGIYHADSLISPKEYATTLFHAVSDREMLEMTMELWQGKRRLFHYCHRHWWLTGFRLGGFSQPYDLTLKASLQFPDFEMMNAFREALAKSCCPVDDFSFSGLSVTVIFQEPCSRQPCQRFPLSCRFSQWKNRLFCRLFLWITRPFTCTADRILYLYYFLPFAFSRTAQVSKPHRYKTRRHKRHRKNVAA